MLALLREAPAHPVSVYITRSPLPHPATAGWDPATCLARVLRPTPPSRLTPARGYCVATVVVDLVYRAGAVLGRGGCHVAVFISSRQACSARIGFQGSGLAPSGFLSAQAQCSLYVRYLQRHFASSFGPLSSRPCCFSLPLADGPPTSFRPATSFLCLGTWF